MLRPTFESKNLHQIFDKQLLAKKVQILNDTWYLEYTVMSSVHSDV